MVSCLLLLRDSHISVRREGGHNVTACGMALADEHVGTHLFAADTREATCPSCIAARDRARADGSGAPPGSEAFAHWLFDMLNRPDAAALAKVMEPTFAAQVPPARLVRLHSLFPGWRARIAETIAQGDCIVVRYDVDFSDPARLLGERATGREQAIVLRLRGSVLIDVTAIVDDFDLWSRARQPARQVRSDAPDRS